MLVCVWKPSNPYLVSFRWPDGRMPRSREPGVGLLLQGELPRGTEQPQTPARPGHETQGQRGKLTDPCVCVCVCVAISSPLAEIKCTGWLYQRPRTRVCDVTNVWVRAAGQTHRSLSRLWTLGISVLSPFSSLSICSDAPLRTTPPKRSTWVNCTKTCLGHTSKNKEKWIIIKCKYCK